MIETTLGEITQITTGKLDANAQDLDGLYPFFTCGEDNLKINTAAFDTEAILLAGNGNFSVKYYKGKFNAYQRTYVIEPNLVYGKWLYYLIMHHIAKITSGARGSTIKYLRIGDITSCPVNLVCIAQQKRTVAKIETLFSELDNGIASLKAAKEQLKVYRQAVLKQAFEGKLTAKWRAQNADKLETPEQLLARIQTERETRYQQQLEDWKEAVKQWETNGKRGKKPSKPKAFKPMAPISNDEIGGLPDLPVGWVYARLAEISLIGSGMSVSKDRKLSEPVETRQSVWYYDYRTNVHHTLKKKPLRFEDLQDFIDCYCPQNRHERQATWHAEQHPEGRWRQFSYDELIARDKASLDVFWLKDKSLTDLDNLPEPDDLAEEIIKNLEAGLTSFRAVLAELA